MRYLRVGAVGKSPVLAALAFTAGLAGCSSSTHSSAPGPAGPAATSTTVATAAKSSLCSADIALDKAQVGITSAAQELQVLKAQAPLVTSLGTAAAGIPDGTVAAAAEQIHAAVEHALSSGSANFAANISSDASAVNTYCGVQYNGSPLPAYFAAGRDSPACARYAALNNQLGRAGSPQAYLSLIESNQAEITRLVTQAPATIKSRAETLETAVGQAVRQKSLAPLQAPSATRATSDVQLYCGIND